MTETKLINANIDESAGIAWITLNRPEKKNALSIALLAEISSLLRGLAENDKIRCIVTAGAGDSYSSGRDLYDMRGQDIQRLWSRISCPTLLLYGKESRSGDPSADGRARHFPRVRVFGVDGAGHWLHHDRLDVFLDTVRAFLKEP